MKKLIMLTLSIALVLTACGPSSGGGSSSQGSASSAPGGQHIRDTLYVLGPVPGPGWTAQAGAYAQTWCEEITSSGRYRAVYLSASSGREQAEQCETIVENGDAAEVILLPLDSAVQAGQQALRADGTPFIIFDRIIQTPVEEAVCNTSGDDCQCGAGIACWLQQNGMSPGDTAMILLGDEELPSVRRREGFSRFLTGELDYQDGQSGRFSSTQTWSQEQVDSLFQNSSALCGWSAGGAYSYAEQQLDKTVAAAKRNGGRLYICAMDDGLALGILNYLDSGASPATLADLEAMEVYLASAGGTRELYGVMDGADPRSDLAGQYFNDMMSMYFSPQMIQEVMEQGLEFLAGVRSYVQGSVEYQPTWVVDAANVSQFEGYLDR